MAYNHGFNAYIAPKDTKKGKKEYQKGKKSPRKIILKERNRKQEKRINALISLK